VSGSYEEGFIEGYLAAFRDLDGDGSSPSDTWQRAGFIWEDKRAAAMHTLTGGHEWLDELMEEERARRVAELANQSTPKPRKPKQGIVYVMLDASARRIKVGWTGGAVEKRRRNLEGATGRSLWLLAAVPGTRDDERAAHARLAESRIKGEWFALTADATEWVVEMAA
jgi:hypothetical protein